MCETDGTIDDLDVAVVPDNRGIAHLDAVTSKAISYAASSN